MRVSIEKQTGRIKLPKDFAKLTKITAEGNFVYTFKYKADIAALLSSEVENRAIRVAIRVQRNEALNQTARVFDVGFSPTEIRENLQRLEAEQQDLARRIAARDILKRNTDISKRIPNNLIQEIRRNAALEATANTPIASLFESRFLSVNSIDAGNRIAPILEANLNKQTEEQEVDATGRLIREASLDLVFNRGVDPAEFAGARTNTVVPAHLQHSGLISDRSFFLQEQADRGRIQEINTLVHTLLTRTQAATHAQLEQAQWVNVIHKVDIFEAEIEEIIEVPGDRITGDTFRVEFDLFNNNNFIVQKLVGVVQHSQNVAWIQTPVIPPNVTGYQLGKKGRNILRITQKDDNATGVAIFRKTITASRFNLNEGYRKISTLSIEAADGEQFFEDVVVSNNPTIYRAVPVGPGGELGSEFTSLVLTSERLRTGLKENWYRRPCYLTLSHEIQETTMALFVDNIPNGPIALDLYRRDLTIKEPFQKTGNTVLLNMEPSRPVEFNDTRLKQGHIYEYQCRLTFADGAIVEAGNNLITEFSALQSNIVNVEVMNLQVETEDPDNVDIRFDIRKNITLTDADTVKAALAERGITEYDDDLEGQKQKLQDLFFIRVERTNLNSGAIEDFGIIDSLSFSDRTFGAVKNVSPLKSETTYKYAVVAHARSAETLLTELTRSVKTSNTESYDLKPSKFLNPITLTEGNIVTPNSQKRNHAKSNFSLGSISDIQYVNVPLGTFLPKLQEVRVSQVNNERVVVRWRIQGDSTKIDHYLIVLELNGMRTVVGKAHSIGNKNDFQFIDSLDNGERGPLQYIVTPVYLDYSRGTEIRTNTILI
jgi:hypothetical protein